VLSAAAAARLGFHFKVLFRELEKELERRRQAVGSKARVSLDKLSYENFGSVKSPTI
jgi:hypothetical protein